MEPQLGIPDNNYKLCKTCNEYKLKSEFYTTNRGVGKKLYYHGNCIICTRKNESLKYRKEIEEQGGNSMVYNAPNRYKDEIQRKNTFNVLETLGYKFDEETGIWTKKGWKEILNGKPHFLYLRKNRKYSNTKPTPEEIEYIISLRKQGFKYNQIQMKTNYSKATIGKYCNEKTH
jgi:hypothetical protein